jgi:hypothetical protein
MPTRSRAARGRRAAWFDPRFAVGILLVAASVGGVYVVVSAADHTTTVYAAPGPLAAGDRVTAGDLVAAHVRVAGADRHYLTEQRMPEAGVVVTRAVGAGELVPLSAVGRVGSATSTRVVVTVRGALPASVGPGVSVDLWSAERLEHDGYGPPAVLAGTVTVVRLVDATGIVTADTVSVELQVPRRTVAAVLQAQANGDALSVVPASTPVGR